MNYVALTDEIGVQARLQPRDTEFVRRGQMWRFAFTLLSIKCWDTEFQAEIKLLPMDF
jgi:hypothetical protein